MNAESVLTDPTTEVREMLERYTLAVQRLDLPGITAHYAPEIVAYDAILQLEFAGLTAYTAHWKACLEQCRSMIFEPKDPTILTQGDLAVGYFLLRCGGAGPDGQEQTGWMRATFAARKQGGRWLIMHEHYSLPFDPVTEKIKTGLEPATATS